MPIYDFKCDKCNTVVERLTFYSERDLPCACSKEGCDGESHFIMSASHFFLEGITGEFPGAAMKWDKRHSQT